jgi:UTP--glucose-1-phosphate uridylyltransferase
MHFRKAVIPMARAAHRALGLQRLTTCASNPKQAVAIQIEDLLSSGIRQVALVVQPQAAPLFRDLELTFGRSLEFLEQPEPLGFGHALLCAEDWIDGEPFVVHVCDHVFISHARETCVKQLIDLAVREDCSVSAVQAHGERHLPYFGIVGGKRVRGEESLYQIETVIEKPSPTVAEAHCMIPGLRQGRYLGFFGMHALTPGIFDHLRDCQQELHSPQPLGLTEALASLSKSEKYLALEIRGQRVDLEGPLGMLRAQIALALHGPRREEVMALMLEEVVQTQSLQLRSALA